MSDKTPPPKSTSLFMGGKDASFGLGMNLAPALAIIAVLGAIASGIFWLSRPGAPPPTEEAGAPALEPVDASSLDGPNDRPPELLKGDKPGTPNVDVPLAPTVVCRILIDTEGRVTEARVFRPRLDLAVFEEEALAAIRDYLFQPGLDEGRPVPVWLNWPISFVNETPPADVKLTIKGSDTIGGALAPALGTAYATVSGGVEVIIQALGSSTAFVGLFDGSADIGASSRVVKPAELARARKLGVELREFVIGYDGISIIVHEDNPIAEMTIAQAGRLFRGEVNNWKEFGWFDLPIHRIGHPNYSGTHSEFKLKIVREGKIDGSGEFAGDVEHIESSEEISSLVAADKTAVGYVGIGWVGPKVKTVALSPVAGAPAIAPSPQSIRSGEYPLFRPLLMYTLGVPSRKVADFLRFVVSAPGRAIVTDNGFVAPEAAITIPSRADDKPDPRVPQIERVYFADAKDKIDRPSLLHLAEVAKVILADPQRRVLLIGNADAGGAAGETLEVSLHRAELVARALEAKGVPLDRLEIEAAAAQRPLETNMTDAGRLGNRRVDIFITQPPSGPPTPTTPPAPAARTSGTTPPRPSAPEGPPAPSATPDEPAADSP